MTKHHTSNLRNRFIAGAAWMTATRWGLRLLGLVNTAILARLLAPADFGLLALAMIVVSFIEIWFWLGVDTALIQNKNATPDDFNSAWTLRIIQGALVALAMVASANLAAEFFNEPRLVAILWMLAPAILLTAANNIGIVNFQKEVNFRPEFIMTLGSKVFSVIVTIFLGFWLRNYWALVFGIFSGYLATFILSYAMHPYRPRFSLKKAAVLWSFSKWVLVGNMGSFLSTKADELIVGKMVTPTYLGIYSVASDIGQMVTNELARPLNRVLFPVFSTIQDDLDRMKSTYLKAIGGVNAVTLPVGIGLALLAPEAVALILGSQWLEAIPYLRIFAIYGAIRFLYSSAPSLLTALGYIRKCAYLQWFESAILVLFCIVGGLVYGLPGIALARVLVAVGVGLITLSFMKRYVSINLSDFVGSLWRPILSTALMAVAIQLAVLCLPNSLIAMFAGKIVVGFISYVASTFMLWRLSGSHDGIESIAFSYLQQWRGNQ